MTIGKLIQSRRTDMGMTQAELAKQFGFSSAQYISNAERGLSGFSASHASKLCKILNIKPSVMRRIYIDEFTYKLDRNFK